MPSAGVILSHLFLLRYGDRSLPGDRRSIFWNQERIMKSKYTVLMATIGGFALGAIAVQALHAQAKPAAYGIAEVTVSNQDGYSKEFLPVVRKTIADAGGKFLAAGGKTESLQGTPPAPRVVIIQWPSLDAADAWWSAAATKDAFALGTKYATFRNFNVEGLPQK
jgi:uncharacterized protein (DUF1330 family)